MDEFRLALRRLTKRPAATLVSIVTLAAAIGAASATWSLLSAVLFRPFPISHPERVVVAGQVDPAGFLAGTVRSGFIYPVFREVRDSRIFEKVAAEWTPPLQLLTVTDRGSLPVRTNVGFASDDFFDLLGVTLSAGRGFSTADDRRGAPPVAILTDRYWRRTFDARMDALGRTIAIAGKPVTIVGIAAAGFRGIDLSQPADLYLPFHTIADVGPAQTNYFADPNHDSSPTWGVRIIGRVANDTTVEAAAARFAALELTEFSHGGARPALVLVPLTVAAVPVGSRAGMNQFARLLGVTVGLLLLIGAGTVGMLLLIRTEARSEELALCMALGASRVRLAGGIVFEGLLLTIAGAVGAIPIAWWLFIGIGDHQLPGGIDIARLDLHVDTPALLAAAAGAALVAMLISLIAGTFALRADVAESLRTRGGATPRVARRRMRAALVAAQVAVAMVLVACAGLFARSLISALSLNAGIDMGRIVSGLIDLRPYGYNEARSSAFFDEVKQRLHRDAAVRDASWSVFEGGMRGGLTIDGVLRQQRADVWFTIVDPDYLKTVGLRIKEGRDFSASDRSGAPLVAIVSASFGRVIAGGGSPIGHHITMPFHRMDHPADVLEVVGVVDDVVTRLTELHSLDVYRPLAQAEPSSTRTLFLRAADDPDAARREALAAIRGVDPSVSPYAFRTLEDRIAAQMPAQRFGMMVLGTLGSIAVLLTVLGAYVLAESMAIARMREMGIRAALGATRHQLGSIVVVETGRLVGAGILVGLGATALGSGMLRAFMFQITPYDPLTLCGVAGLVMTLTLLVTLRPALRAARVDVASVLKDT